MALKIKRNENSIHFFLLLDIKNEKPSHVVGLNLSNICIKRVIAGGAEYTSGKCFADAIFPNEKQIYDI